MELLTLKKARFRNLLAMRTGLAFPIYQSAPEFLALMAVPQKLRAVRRNGFYESQMKMLLMTLTLTGTFLVSEAQSPDSTKTVFAGPLKLRSDFAFAGPVRPRAVIAFAGPIRPRGPSQS